MLISGALPLLAGMAALAGASLAVAADLPPPEQYRANWPRFRGPEGAGVYASGDVPVTCNGETGENIAWKVDVPMEGFSSPIVWGDQIFLSGSHETRCEVMSFDVVTGRLQWRERVTKMINGADPMPKAPEGSGMAAGTLATDGRRVYAMFADGKLEALDFAGKELWFHGLGTPKNIYGHATSLLTWRDDLIVQLDQGEAGDELSKLYALDGATGKVLWEKPRPVGASWATPIIVEAAGKPQLITLGMPWVIAYAPNDGAEIWRAECLDGEVTPSPIFAGGTLFVVSPTSKLQAIRPDGQGEVTNTPLGWVGEDGIPDITSPVSNGELVFVLDSSGVLTCYDAKTGRKQWDNDFSEECKASPSIAGNKVYVVTRKGTLIVVDAARQFKELARSSLGEEVFASPAFAPHKIIVRGLKHLFCIGDKKS